MTNKKCDQLKCNLLGTGMCPVCPECNAEADMIDNDCHKCWNCLKDEGIIRGDVGGQQAEAIPEIIMEAEAEEEMKIIEVKTK